MKLFGDASVLRGSIAWTRPLGLQISILHHPPAAPEPAAMPEAPSAQPVELDEEGRRYVFRYAAAAPQRYVIERERIFDYLERRRLPSERQRRARRDVRNTADFFADVRDLQTEPEVDPRA